jgi:hypothetical protein
MTDEQMRELVKECGLDWHRGYMPLFDGDPTNRYAVLIEAVIEATVAAQNERCAAWVDARLAAFCSENGSMDPDTGAIEFGRGASAQAKDEYVGEMAEIAEGLRALGPNVGGHRHATHAAKRQPDVACPRGPTC